MKPDFSYMDPDEYARFFVPRDEKVRTAGSNGSSLDMNLVVGSLSEFISELANRKGHVDGQCVHARVRIVAGNRPAIEVSFTAHDANLNIVHTRRLENAPLDGNNLTPRAQGQLSALLNAVRQRLRTLGVQLVTNP